MVAITRSGRYYLSAFGVAFVAGLAFGNFSYLLIGLLLVGFLLVGMRRSVPADVEIHRTIEVDQATVGETVSVHVQVTVKRGQGFLIVHDRLPSMFDLVDGNNTHLVWKGGQPKRVDYRYSFKCTKRGGYILAGTQALGVSALGLTEPVRIGTGPEHQLTVEPRVLRVRTVKPMRGKARTVFPSGDKARMGTRTSDFAEIREYQRGDPLKSVNWKATAKASHEERLELMVNEYDVEGKKSVWFFIDAADYMEVGSTLQNTFDQTVEAALEILEYFINRGYRVGGTVFNTVGDEHEAPVFYPDHGRSQYIKVVKVLTGLTTSRQHEGLPAAVERVRGFLAREKPLILLVTRPEGDIDGTFAGVKRVLSYVATGRLRTPVMLVAPQVRSVAAESQDVSDLALMVAEQEAAVTNKRLRRLGVQLIEWDPQHSSVAAVLARGVRTR